MKIMEGGLGNIEGVTSGGFKEGKYGVALVKFPKVCKADAVYTTNKMVAAPLQVTKKKIASGVWAIVANSGNANCSTGKKGLEDAEAMCRKAAEALDVDAKNVMVVSTGIIGKYLDMETVNSRIEAAAGRMGKNCESAARAIMTTDRNPKILCIDFGGFKIAGIAKGAGMIHPNMATMICLMATDAAFAKGDLKYAVDRSFNMMSIDNDMSTNDIALLVSTGAKKATKFRVALTHFCQEMAKMMVADGEGVTKVVEIEVKGAKSDADAKKAARAIADSCLVKTAVFGNNPNWGRVAAAVGYSGVALVSEKMKIWYVVNGRKTLLYDGFAKEFDKHALGEEMKLVKEIKIIVDLGLGTRGSRKTRTCAQGRTAPCAGDCLAWSGDFSFDYVKINAGYN